MQKPDKFVYFFAAGESEGNASMKNILGGKGANLAEMTSLGLPVPPGFTISTEICSHFYENGGNLPEWVRPAAETALARVEKKIGKKFGDVKNPLLVSVRSGARASWDRSRRARARNSRDAPRAGARSPPCAPCQSPS